MFTLQVKNPMLIALTFVGQLINPFGVAAHIIGDAAHDGPTVRRSPSAETVKFL